ncbi:MAG: efflux transporter outer membrane subunit [Pirellulaceae bacterium]
MSARRRMGTTALLLAALLLGGCTTGLREYVHNGFKVGPNYQRPAAPVADEWIDSESGRLQIGPVDDKAWWQLFQDPVLDRLVLTAYQQNITLREAGFRIAEAQSQRAVTVGNLFPQTQELFGDYTRTQRSTQTATFPQGAALPPGLIVTNFSTYRLGGALAWELDFWGRYRRAIESADARLDSEVENYDDVLVLLIAEVASTYVDIRTLEQRLDYARSNVALQGESARIAGARLDAAAVDSEVDAPQARSNLARTQAAIQLLEVEQRQAQNRLAVLMGMPPHDLGYLLAGERGIPQAPQTVAIDLPASLLRRRPDVRRAERLVAQQSALIGVAETNLYPAISINGSLALEAATFERLFNSDAWSGTVGPAFRWNVLNYGRLVNLVNVEEARLQQQIAQYQQTVLEANEEAENAIVGFRLYHDQIGYLNESVAQAQEAVRVTQLKYQEGQIDFNRVFTLEQLLVTQQDQLAISAGNSAQSLIQLYRAMGGGWEMRLYPPPPVALPPVGPAVEPEADPEVDPEVVVPPQPARP